MQTDDPEKECMKSFSTEELQPFYSADCKGAPLEKSEGEGRSRAGNSLFRRLSRVIIDSATQGGFWTDFRYFVISACVVEFLKPRYKRRI